MVVLTGASTALGRRVAMALGALDDVEVVPVARPSDDEPVDLAPLLDADGRDLVLVHLAAGDHDSLERTRRSALAGTAELLAAATEFGIDDIVLLSSAMAYGAWPNNPVPLTEDAPLRPDEGFVFARQLAAVEQIVDAWRTERPGRRVAVLRPVPAMAADGTSRLVSALAAGLGMRAGEDDAPAQFVHLDDLASAVVLAALERLDGPYNVAPDGAVDAPTLRSLSGAAPRLRLPGWMADVVSDLRWRFQRGPIPPGLRPYTRWPWLVANDRLRSAGWRPTVTNEQAFVEGTEDRWWTMLSPKRKQELSLGAMVLGVLGLGITSLVIVRRVRSRRAARRA